MCELKIIALHNLFAFIEVEFHLCMKLFKFILNLQSQRLHVHHYKLCEGYVMHSSITMHMPVQTFSDFADGFPAFASQRRETKPEIRLCSQLSELHDIFDSPTPT